MRESNRSSIRPVLGPALAALVLLCLSALSLSAQGQPSAQDQEAARLYQAGDWPAAVDAYREIVRERPEDAAALLRLGRALIEVEREAEALEIFDRSAEAGMQSPFLQVYRARALARLGRNDEALDALETIQPVPALGGAATFDQLQDFVALQEMPRFQAFLEAVDAAAYPCRADPMNREFDFWIGEWAVFANGQRAGTNRIERMLGSCVLLENWTNIRGREGKSFNWVDRSTAPEPRWRQLWVADQGNTLDYDDGHYDDGVMRFQGHTLSPEGDTVLQRLDFVNVHPDTVRQIFYQSTDEGTSWQETWQGLYIRMESDTDGSEGSGGD